MSCKKEMSDCMDNQMGRGFEEITLGFSKKIEDPLDFTLSHIGNDNTL